MSNSHRINEEINSESEILNKKMIVVMTGLSFAVGIYSLIKWYSIGYNQLAHTAWCLVVVQPLVVLLSRKTKSPYMFLAHLSIGSMAFYCVSVIYHLGGIDSPHIFWVIGIVIFSYSFTDLKGGVFWSTIMIACEISFIKIKENGIKLPNPTLTDAQIQLDIYSGYLLPTFMIAIGMGVIFKYRSDSLNVIEEVLQSLKDEKSSTTMLSEELINIVQQANIGSATLLVSAKELSDTTNTMTKRSDLIKQGIDSQLVATNTVNSSTREIASSVRESTEAMDTMKLRSEEVLKKTESGSEAMKEAVAFMENIRESNSNIVQFMSVITGIADQTNLLALNAAIEAARAGESGRGFAVVADEVRALSVRSNDSAREIKTLLEKAERNIEQGASAVIQTGEYLEEIVSEVGDISKEINLTADRMNQQNIGLEDIVKNIKKMEQICQENSGSSEGLSDSANSLLEMSTRLGILAQMMSDMIAQAKNIDALSENQDINEAELF